MRLKWPSKRRSDAQPPVNGRWPLLSLVGAGFRLTPMTLPTANLPAWLQAARAHWSWRGQVRPPFATKPGAGQTSVWDFPRPPRLAPEARELRVVWGGVAVATSTRALRVLETGHPPTYYIPWSDVERRLLEPAAGSSFCEWKGPARYWT